MKGAVIVSEKKLRAILNRALRAVMPRNNFGIKLESFISKSYYAMDKSYPYRGYEAMQSLLKNYAFDTVLDVGCGEGIHSDIFLKAGKKVTAIDYGKSPYFSRMKAEPGFSCIVDDFMTHDFGNEKFDCVWCCHVLEHQLNTQDFLKKLVSLVKTTYPGGIGYQCPSVMKLRLSVAM